MNTVKTTIFHGILKSVHSKRTGQREALRCSLWGGKTVEGCRAPPWQVETHRSQGRSTEGHPGLITIRTSCCSIIFQVLEIHMFIQIFLPLSFSSNPAARSMKCYHCFGNQFNHFLPLVIKIISTFWASKFYNWNLPSRNHLKCRKSLVQQGVHCSEAEALNGIKVTSDYDILVWQRTGY